MFEIRLLPGSEISQTGGRLGQITVGSFQERFACSLAFDGIEERWRQALRSMVAGAPLAVLPHDSRFAWIIYREGRTCFVRQRLSLDGAFDDLLPRETISDNGMKVSEWVTTLEAIEDFLQT